MSYTADNRVVMTLDAGGTNFVFTAIKGCQEIVKPITKPSNAHDLEKCLKGMIDGFKQVRASLVEEPVAISFAFPGPADYPNGIIGDLVNLPAFRGGVAVGPMLEEIFKIPVFVNNDGDLYAYGEAIAGFLPAVNELMEKSGRIKKYRNLMGFTLGTGFGAGIVHNNQLYIGDNSAAAEVWALSNIVDSSTNIEELISIRAVRREYARQVGIAFDKSPNPKEIYDIAMGTAKGDKEAALKSYRKFGLALGDAISNMLTVMDCIAVIGGGVAGAKELFFPAMFEVLRGKFENGNNRIAQNVFNLDDENELAAFAQGEVRIIDVPFTDKKIPYDSHVRLGVGITKIGASTAISIGAYSFALSQLDK